MGSRQAMRFGALELARGHLWLGMPASSWLRRELPIRWRKPVAVSGIRLDPAGLRCFNGGLGRRQGRWDAMSWVGVTVDELPEPPEGGPRSGWRRAGKAAGFTALIGAAAAAGINDLGTGWVSGP